MTEIDRADHVESSSPQPDQLLVRQIAQHYYGCEPQGLTQLTRRTQRGASPAVASLCDRAVQQYRAYGQRWSSA